MGSVFALICNPVILGITSITPVSDDYEQIQCFICGQLKGIHKYNSICGRKFRNFYHGAWACQQCTSKHR